ncbi:ribonuclease T2 family protein [Paracoccus aestuariivivens]|uniref:Ribonuclease T n=1 Tax=Paracoccus aestuariivivens TaxID=1820333 RepID=A0A6L6JBU9_9RHOB|nr:ribonuclease T2 [Paracoccus aestuariivivens]MTH77644.1 ribonuclease T [Paracoccus aestuariivivens]
MKTLIALILATCLTTPAQARDRAGDFDYYVLSLSWSPSWCAQEGSAEGSEQCDPGRKLGFTVHGLWPQHEKGWPEDCATNARDPSRRETRDMADVMGTSGLAWYQWKKHGRCSGLTAHDYFALVRTATKRVHLPEVLNRLSRDVTLPSRVIEQAFLETNPDMKPEGITVTCRARALQEVRICLTKDLEPRQCAHDSRRDCQGTFLMQAPR